MSLIIFTRDLRTEYNELLNIKGEKYPLFVFCEQQTSPQKNDHFSQNSFNFMLYHLDKLSKKIPLSFVKINSYTTSQLDAHIKLPKHINKVVIAKDFTPFALKRERILKEWCKKKNLEFCLINNHTLCDYEDLYDNIRTKTTNTVYKLYTPFKNGVKKYIKTPNKTSYKKSDLKYLPFSSKKILYSYPKNYSPPPLNPNGKYIKDTLSIDTSRLSAYNKFGIFSIRNTYKKYPKLHDNLVWREFYYYILIHHPNVLTTNFKPSPYNWVYNASKMKAYTTAKTGIPIVDACITQLLETGWMHNRGRLIVSFFLTKNLNISWKYGEKFFAQYLVDYDPAQNNGNWQWSAGTGVDPLKYGKPRTMNMWSQSVKYDPKGEYIKKWLPIFKDVPVKDIHRWDVVGQKYIDEGFDYIRPIVKI